LQKTSYSSSMLNCFTDFHDYLSKSCSNLDCAGLSHQMSSKPVKVSNV
jgi:hypothetical protein